MIEATFGARQSNRFAAPAATAATAEKRPTAEFWLNPGFVTPSTKYPFVSLPVGLPLSLDDRKEIRGNTEYAKLLSAQNDLLEEIIERAQKLAPGEDLIVMMPVQIRRVRGEQEQVASTENELSPRGKLFGEQVEPITVAE
jgi:hypothetical protein